MGVIQDRRPSVGWGSVWLLSIIIILNEIPYTARILFRNATVLPFMALFLLFSFSYRNILTRRNCFFAFALFFLVLIQMFYKAVGISTSGFGVYVNVYSHFFFFFAMFAVFRMSEKQKAVLFSVLVGSILFSVIENTLLYRRLGFDYFMDYVENESILSNATSTQFSVAIMLMSGITLICILKAKHHRGLWIALFIVLVCFNIFVAQRATNLILAVVLCGYILLVNQKHRIYADVLMVLCMIVIVIAILNYGAVIDFVSNAIGSARISEKLSQIKRAMDAGDVMQGRGSLTARYVLYTRSLETWLSSFSTFLFGVGEHYEDNTLIGNHSQVCDSLGQYGIVGATLIFYTVYWTLKNLVRHLPIKKQSSTYRQVMAVLVVFAIKGVLGSVLYGAIAIQLFIFLPIALSYVEKGEHVI